VKQEFGDSALRANIILIGGCGVWSAVENHVPAILEAKRNGLPVRVAVICDPRDPRAACAQRDDMRAFEDLLNTDKPAWVTPAGQSERELTQTLDELHREHDFKLAIIACGPVDHYVYLKWSAQHGIHVLCDKPIICVADSASSRSAAEQMSAGFEEILTLVRRNQSKGPYFIAIPLRRRANDAYLTVAKSISEVAAMGQGMTFATLTTNAGLYRFPEEYRYGDAHGYQRGIGSLAFSSYHYIDVLSWFLTLAPGGASYLRITNPFVRRLGEYLAVPESRFLGKLIDENAAEAEPVLPDQVLASEVDFVFHIELLDEQRRCCGLLVYSCISTGYSHRTVPISAADRLGSQPFREKGRMSQFVLEISQGSLQHIAVVRNDVASGPGEIRVQRRRNPLIASEHFRNESFENAHEGSSITPMHITQAVIALASGTEVDRAVLGRISFLEQQALTHSIFAAFYTLIAANYEARLLSAPRQAEEVVVSLSGRLVRS
jgi:hypothetical protein